MQLHFLLVASMICFKDLLPAHKLRALLELKLATELIMAGDLQEPTICQIEKNLFEYHKAMRILDPQYKYRVNDHKILHIGVSQFYAEHRCSRAYALVVSAVSAEICDLSCPERKLNSIRFELLILTSYLESLSDERLQGDMGNWSLSGRDDCTEMFRKQVIATALASFPAKERTG